MSMTDPVADMLTRIRNANTAGHAEVSIPASKIKKNIAEILLKEGYIKAFLDSMDMSEYFIDYEEWGRTGLLKADNIRLVMERNGCDNAVYIGDIQNDSNAAHEAGIPCIYAAYGFGEIADAEGTIYKFAKLPEELERIGLEF